MIGVNYVVNKKGEKVGVFLDLKKHKDLWEDIEDLLIAKEREYEPRESLEKVKRILQSKGRLA